MAMAMAMAQQMVDHTSKSLRWKKSVERRAVAAAQTQEDPGILVMVVAMVAMVLVEACTVSMAEDCRREREPVAEAAAVVV